MENALKSMFEFSLFVSYLTVHARYILLNFWVQLIMLFWSILCCNA